VRQCFERIGHAVENLPKNGSVSLLAIHLNEVLYRILEMFRSKDVWLDESLGTALRTTELFWNDLAASSMQLSEPWTVGRMAQRCGMSASQFVRQSKRLYNMTPNKYLNYCRLRLAARLLIEQPERTVTDIGSSVGFSSSQYFATVFRRETGCTPLEFRACPPKGSRLGESQALPGLDAASATPLFPHPYAAARRPCTLRADPR
jgi:AraC family L-rhamnose operon regulatory protein RhaS